MGEEPIERVDRVIDRLDAALRAVGLDALAPAAESEVVAELDGAIAPYSLPPHLRRFWERVDFARLPVSGWTLPEPLGPRAALETHRTNLSELPLLFGPPVLFPIGRISGDQWSVELMSLRSPGGGTVFSQSAGAEALRIEYACFCDLLEVYAELLEVGRFTRSENGRAWFSLEDERSKQEPRLRAALDPLYGDAREISADPGAWPAHWLAAAGLDIRGREPRGATHTIAELAAAGPTAARIAGEVVRLSGSAAGTLVVVSDGVAELPVFCPPGATVWGLAMGGRYEFEVLAGEPTAVASAVRPLR